MPAVTTQSRAGLITTLVIFVVLFFIAAILAAVKTSDFNARDKAYNDLVKKYQTVINDSDMIDPAYAAADDARKAAQLATRWQAVLSQREQLARRISGAPFGSDTTNIADLSVAKANERLAVPTSGGSPIAGSSLTDAIGQLVTQIESKQKQVTQLEQDLAARKAELASATSSYTKELDTRSQHVSAAQAQQQKTVTDTNQYRAEKDAQIGKLEEQVKTEIDRGRKTAEDIQTQLNAKIQELTDLQKKYDRAIQRVAKFRPSVGDSILRRPDGQIVQVTAAGVAYINLGLGQQVSPGLTFTVYDKTEGIPKENPNSDELPDGKASVEVVRVGPNQSEVRIIKIQPGQQLAAGDLVANLVYDPNLHYSFKVFGKFDLDGNKVATDQEAEVLKRLITQWGGVVTDNVNVDTDFVVMGVEPVLPEKPKDDDVLLKFNYDKAVAELKAYDDVKKAAQDLYIPILNQNRFLFLVGYYDQARK